MTDDVSIQFGANTAGVAAGAQEVKHHISDLSSEVDKAEELFKYLGERMLEVFALHEITEYVSKVTELGEQIERISAMTGLSSESVQTLGFALQRTGGSAEEVGSMVTRLEANIQNAVSGTGRAYEAFEKLGVSLDDLKHASIDDLLQKTAAGFRNLNDAVERSAVARDIGGRGFAQMLPALLESADGLEAYHEKLVALNDDLSEKTVKALSETKGELVDLGRAVQGAGVQGFLTFKGAIDGVITDFTAAAVVIGQFLGYLRELQVVAGEDVVIAVARMIDAVESFAARAKFAADDVMIRWKEMGAIITEVATLNWSKIADVQAEADAQLKEAFDGDKRIPRLHSGRLRQPEEIRRGRG